MEVTFEESATRQTMGWNMRLAGTREHLARNRRRRPRNQGKVRSEGASIVAALCFSIRHYLALCSRGLSSKHPCRQPSRSHAALVMRRLHRVGLKALYHGEHMYCATLANVVTLKLTLS